MLTKKIEFEDWFEEKERIKMQKKQQEFVRKINQRKVKEERLMKADEAFEEWYAKKEIVLRE